ncbi:hypothetical protein [Natrinema salaciae]|uniref:Small CPxCG-related zinc finger protein n=1 Tax=Natrinema salaciae TaxID=1186196 RepID=A0A1H9S1K3_9EURY|nr:hypothetical protein [Natrinema salaciae]SER78814.1 hypothetical protein SAMN04489841_4544 [Natrinema salaciae]
MSNDGDASRASSGSRDSAAERGERGDPDDLADGPMDCLESALPDCPRCGRTVWVVSAIGPGEGTASPCGCPVVPGTLERD